MRRRTSRGSERSTVDFTLSEFITSLKSMTGGYMTCGNMKRQHTRFFYGLLRLLVWVRDSKGPETFLVPFVSISGIERVDDISGFLRNVSPEDVAKVYASSATENWKRLFFITEKDGRGGLPHKGSLLNSSGGVDSGNIFLYFVQFGMSWNVDMTPFVAALVYANLNIEKGKFPASEVAPVPLRSHFAHLQQAFAAALDSGAPAGVVVDESLDLSTSTLDNSASTRRTPSPHHDNIEELLMQGCNDPRSRPKRSNDDEHGTGDVSDDDDDAAEDDDDPGGSVEECDEVSDDDGDRRSSALLITSSTRSASS